MKRKISYIVLSVFALMLLAQCAAMAESVPLIGEEGYLSDTESLDVFSWLVGIRNEYNMDVAVYIEDTMSGYDAESAADDIFDYNGYGVGESKDGILLYISKNPRRYHYSTHGKGERVFNDRALEYLDSMVLPYLQNNNYYQALKTYAEVSRELLEDYANGRPYNKKDGTTTLIAWAVAIFAPLVTALFATSSKLKKMKTAVSNNHADSYIKPGSMKVSVSRDLFLYSVVNRTRREKSSSGGGHTSSSGEHHGGRGGSY